MSLYKESIKPRTARRLRAANEKFIPLRMLFPWPEEFLPLPEDSKLLDEVGVQSFIVDNSGSFTKAEFDLVILKTVSFDLMQVNGISFLAGNENQSLSFTGAITFGKSLLVEISNLDLTIRFKTELFRAATKQGDSYIAIMDTEGNYLPFDLVLQQTTFSIDDNFNLGLSLESGISFGPVMIGDTGIVIEAESLSLHFSKDTPPPSGFEDDFQGIYFESLKLFLPPGISSILPEGIEVKNAGIGSGGFTGTVILDLLTDESVTDYDPARAKSFLGFSFTLQYLELEIKQNAISRSSIVGFLKVPFFDEDIEIHVGLCNDGDFTISLSDQDGLLELTKDNVISVVVTSLEFIKDDDIYAIKISGEITPLLPGIEWPSFQLKGLEIRSDGTVKVDGGWIDLPELKLLNFYSFNVEIEKLGFGSDEIEGTLYKWIGFSGGIELVKGLPLRGGVEGLKVMWDASGNVKLKIGGVYLSFEVENVLTFDGEVNFIDKPLVKEFRGCVSLKLIPVNFGVDAEFITGTTPEFNYFYLYINLDLPVGIPLGPPVLGLFGIAGLYGQNMGLNYQDLINYTDESERPDLSDSKIWDKKKGSMAFGAGITLGTFPDVMFTVKTKALFVILIPGPVILLEGDAAILSTGDTYPLKILAVLDPASGTYLMNISAIYKFPVETGMLIDIFGSAEAYFSAADPGAWHVYLGEEKPESKRIRADILNFFKAQTYLMVDNNGLSLGAWIGYSFNKTYGILRVVLEAWISGKLSLSRMPLQAKGEIALYGNAELSASMVSLGISAEAKVIAEAPKPLGISAEIKVQLKTPLGKPKATIKLDWQIEGTPPFPVPLSVNLGIEHRKVSKNWSVTKTTRYIKDKDGLYTGEELEPALSFIPVVPPDVFLVLNFDKPVDDYCGITGNTSRSDSYEEVGNYEFKYELKNIRLSYLDDWNEQEDGQEWNEYVREGYSLSGYWQYMPDARQQVNTKLVINASTPFEISRMLSESGYWFTMLDVYNPGYPCGSDTTEEQLCADFETRETGTYHQVLVQNTCIFSSVFPMEIYKYEASWLQTEKALRNPDSYKFLKCLNIKGHAITEQLNFTTLENVFITAGIGYDSYLMFTDNLSNQDTELYINFSIQNPGFVPAFIYFPQIHFEDYPHNVYISCHVNDGGTSEIIAFDEEQNEVYKVVLNPDLHPGNYVLKSNGTPIRKMSVTGSRIRITSICLEQNIMVPQSAILITMPEEMITTDIYLSENSNGKVLTYNKDQSVIEEHVFDISDSTPDVSKPITITSGQGSFRSMLITGHFGLIRVCGLSLRSFENSEYNAGVKKYIQDTVEETWGQHTSQILEPGKYYRVEIETSASRRKNGGSWTEQVFTEYMYFKTGNPPGQPIPEQTEVEDALRYDLNLPLSSIASYVSFTIPEGSTADSPIAPWYRSYDIGIVFNESYVEQMYQMADMPLRIKLMDNNNLPVTNRSGEPIELINSWSDNPEVCLTREEKEYQDVLNESGCLLGTTYTVESNDELFASSRDLLLQPQIQYRAQVFAGEKQVFEFALISSVYVNFMHHIYSFSGMLWDHFELLGDENYSVDKDIISQVLINSETEEIKFEQLMELFDLNPRILPIQTEICLIRDNSHTFGFLIESPEPFNWTRTTLSVEWVDKRELSEEGWISPVKIIGGSISRTNFLQTSIEPDFNDQWIDIFPTDTTDLSSYTLEYRSVTAREEEAFQQYFTFSEGAGLSNAGTLIRIYNGAEPETEADPVEHTHLYASHLRSLYNSEGIIVNLKNSESQVVFSTILYDQTMFSSIASRIVRNKDGSRVFVFPEKNNEFDPGLYQFKWSFNRDIGSDVPMYKRFGFSDPEEAILAVVL